MRAGRRLLGFGGDLFGNLRARNVNIRRAAGRCGAARSGRSWRLWTTASRGCNRSEGLSECSPDGFHPDNPERDRAKLLDPAGGKHPPLRRFFNDVEEYWREENAE